MSAPVENNDRQTTAAALLIDIFREKPQFLKLLSSYVAETQELENALFELGDAFWVNTAVGAQLDGIGEIVGIARDGADDTTYRIRIKARVLINLSSGTPNEILTLVRALLPAGASDPSYTPYYPAAFAISVTGLTPTEVAEIAAAVIETTPVGVRSNFMYSLDTDSNTFQFSSDATSQSSTIQGFADLAQTTGGKLSGVITNG